MTESATPWDAAITVAGVLHLRQGGHWGRVGGGAPRIDDLLDRIAELERALENADGRAANLEADAHERQQWGWI